MPRSFEGRADEGGAAVTIGTVLRKARASEQISVRELSRRSGISAGQVSRIESGDVAKPELATVTALAKALGVPAVPMLFLAGHVDEAALEGFIGGREGSLDTEDPFLILHGEVQDGRGGVTGPRDAAAYLVEHWSKSSLARELGYEDDEQRKQIEEIAAAWAGLTDDRRRLVLAVVSDQEVLSRLDRMPNPAGRYLPEITLHAANGDDE